MKLLSSLVQQTVPNDVKVTGMTIDSRQVRSGDVFFAYPGVEADGRNYIAAAVSNGAVAIVAEQTGWSEKYQAVCDQLAIPCVLVADLQRVVGMFADRYFGHPSKKLDVIGVTGTNGKTSIVTLIAQAYSLLGKQAASIGTVGSGRYGELQQSSLTTPDAISLQAQLAKLVADDVEHVAIEASSHGLEGGRVNGVNFDSAIFTNLTHDHLDYHGSMEAYGEAKRRLFAFPGLKNAIINVDDAFGSRIINGLSPEVNVITISMFADANADIFPKDLVVSQQGIEAVLNTPWGLLNMQVSLLGRFNVINLMAVIAVLLLDGVAVAQIEAVLPKLNTVVGRMQSFGGNGLPLCLVDYAHTPDALEQILKTACEIKEGGRLLCVFGCGGDRDAQKRPMMAQIAERYADEIILTSDNPRNEQPEHIINDIVAGFTKEAHYHIELDRQAAIKVAIERAQPADIVIIAGKGHESYQIVGEEKYPSDDGAEVRLVLDGYETT